MKSSASILGNKGRKSTGLQTHVLLVKVSNRKSDDLVKLATERGLGCVQDVNHSSNSAYLPYDNYTEEVVHPQWWPKGYTHHISGHACYDPSKAPAQFSHSYILRMIPSKVVQNGKPEPLRACEAHS